MTKHAYFGPNLAILGPKILILTGRSKSFGIHVTEIPPRHLVRIVFGHPWDQMGQKKLFIFRFFVNFGADYEDISWKHDLPISWFLLYNPEEKYKLWTFFEILENETFGKLRVMISKEGDKLWRWKGYILISIHRKIDVWVMSV